MDASCPEGGSGFGPLTLPLCPGMASVDATESSTLGGQQAEFLLRQKSFPPNDSLEGELPVLIP